MKMTDWRFLWVPISSLHHSVLGVTNPSHISFFVYVFGDKNLFRVLVLFLELSGQFFLETKTSLVGDPFESVYYFNRQCH